MKQDNTVLENPTSTEWDERIPYSVVKEPPPANEWDEPIPFSLVESPLEFCKTFVIETPAVDAAE